jgi:CheY-like chemotaxis protein
MISALVIDDVRQTADSICQMLKLLDIDAFPAYGPRAAMVILSEKIPDIIFLDLSMPGVSGIEVLGYLRREPNLQDIPVFVITSDDQEDTHREVLEKGVVDILIKPVRIEGLERALQSTNLA